MSGTNERRLRREMVKAFGEGTVQHIEAMTAQLADITNALNNQILPNVNALHVTVLEQQKTLSELRRIVASQNDRLLALEAMPKPDVGVPAAPARSLILAP